MKCACGAEIELVPNTPPSMGEIWRRVGTGEVSVGNHWHKPACEACQEAARHAYSDGTTPGFFRDKCEKHRKEETDAKAHASDAGPYIAGAPSKLADIYESVVRNLKASDFPLPPWYKITIGNEETPAHVFGAPCSCSICAARPLNDSEVWDENITSGREEARDPIGPVQPAVPWSRPPQPQADGATAEAVLADNEAQRRAVYEHDPIMPSRSSESLDAAGVNAGTTTTAEAVRFVIRKLREWNDVLPPNRSLAGLAFWMEAAFAQILQPIACEYCGPLCYGGAEHHARVEGGDRWELTPAAPEPRKTWNDAIAYVERSAEFLQGGSLKSFQVLLENMRMVAHEPRSAQVSQAVITHSPLPQCSLKEPHWLSLCGYAMVAQSATPPEPQRGPHLLTARNGEKIYCGGLGVCEFCIRGVPATPPEPPQIPKGMRDYYNERVDSLESALAAERSNTGRAEQRIAKLDALATELVTALRGIIDVGKRDMRNPKYSPYFDYAKEVLDRLSAEALAATEGETSSKADNQE